MEGDAPVAACKNSPEVVLTYGRIKHVWSVKCIRGTKVIMLGSCRLNGILLSLSLSLSCSSGLAALCCRRGLGGKDAQASQRWWQACQQRLHQQ